MPPDRRFVESALSDIEGMVRFLRVQAARSAEEFHGSLEACYSTAYALVAAIEGVIGIAVHLVAGAGRPPPLAAADAFEELARMGVLNESSFKGRLVTMVQFRNLLVHRYQTVDYRRVREIIQTHLGDFGLYARCVTEHLDRPAPAPSARE